MRNVAFILCLASVAGMAYSADGKSDFKRFIRKETPRMARAFNHRDASYFDRTATADFTQTAGGQTISRADSVKEMKQLMAGAKSIHCHIELVSSSQHGDVGVAIAHGHWVMIMKPNGPKDKPHTMVIDGGSKSTWRRSGKTWKVQKLEESGHEKMTMDGKPYNPGAPGGK